MQAFSDKLIAAFQAIPPWLRYLFEAAIVLTFIGVIFAGGPIWRITSTLANRMAIIVADRLNSLILFEAAAVVLVLLLAFIKPGWGRSALGRFLRQLGNIRPAWSIVLCGSLAAGGAAAVAILVRWPEPLVPDEFGYLLLADTFRSGKLTNATHKLWVHFESQHIIHVPSYTAKFPPAQGFFLALGQLLSGHPLVGVWLSLGLAAAAIAWMLHAWLPARWATLGGLLAAIRLTFWGWPFSTPDLTPIGPAYWAQSYWGGAVAAMGGALVFGAFRRIYDAPRISHSVWLGLGLGILALSRPFEGFVISLPVAAGLAWWFVSGKAPSTTAAIGRVLLPTTLVVGLAAAFIGWYNHTVTGDAFRLPYQVHQSMYSGAPHFLWQPLPAEKVYRHETLRDYFQHWSIHVYREQKSVPGFCFWLQFKLVQAWAFYLGPALTIPFLFLPAVLRFRWALFALLTCGLLGCVLLFALYYFPHYSAPATGLLFFLLIVSLRRMALWRWRRRPIGKVFVFGTVSVCLLSVVPAIHLIYFNEDEIAHFGTTHRARLVAQLEKEKGRHLVLVQYSKKHPVFEEWVFNKADIDNADIVWTQVMGPKENHRLLEHFQDRKIWLLEADRSPPRLRILDRRKLIARWQDR